MPRKKVKKGKINSIRVYLLNRQRMVVGGHKESYGIDKNNILEFDWEKPSQLKEFALKQVTFDKTRPYKFEVRTNKGRYLFDK